MVAGEIKTFIKSAIEQMSEKECWMLYGIIQEYDNPKNERADLVTKEQAYAQLLGEVVETWEPVKHKRSDEIIRLQMAAVAAIALKFQVELL